MIQNNQKNSSYEKNIYKYINKKLLFLENWNDYQLFYYFEYNYPLFLNFKFLFDTLNFMRFVYFMIISK